MLKMFFHICVNIVLFFKVSKIWFMSNNYGVKLKLTKAQIKPTTKLTIDVDFV